MGVTELCEEELDRSVQQELLQDALYTAVQLEMENMALRKLLEDRSEDRTLIRDFWNCGDGALIAYSMMRARLNRRECEVLHLLLDECMTQEEAAEHMGVSVRRLQTHWYSATDKLLQLPWVVAYAGKVRRKKWKKTSSPLMPE